MITTISPVNIYHHTSLHIIFVCANKFIFKCLHFNNIIQKQGLPTKVCLPNYMVISVLMAYEVHFMECD